MERFPNLNEALAPVEKIASNTFKFVCENYSDLIEDLLDAYKSMRYHVFNVCETFYQDIVDMKKRYQGKTTVNMFANYCWQLLRDVSEANFSWKIAKKSWQVHFYTIFVNFVT